MQISKIQTNIQSTHHKSYNSQKAVKNCNTNPLACDTFTPSVSFKAKIHDYAEKGDLEGLKRELANGVDVNSQDDMGDTALIWAIVNGHTEIADELLKQPNINVNIKNKYGNTALIWANREGHIEIVKELLKHPNIDVNSIDESKNTALILASLMGQIEIVKELLKHPNIDVNIKNARGKTALYYANQEIKKMIREYVPGVDRREGVGVNIKKYSRKWI